MLSLASLLSPSSYFLRSVSLDQTRSMARHSGIIGNIPFETSNDEIKAALKQSTTDIPDSEDAIIAKIHCLKEEQSNVYRTVTGRNRRQPHIDAPTPYHIPEYRDLEADIIRLQDALPGDWQTVVTVNRGLSNLYVVDAAHKRGLNAVLLGTPEECKVAVNDGFDQIIPIAAFNYMDGPAILDYVKEHVESVDPRRICINPGIAFLSERGDFSGQVSGRGYDYMGGSEAAVSAVGDKTEAKELANEAFDKMNAEDKSLFLDQQPQSPIIPSLSTAGVPQDEWLALIRTALADYGDIMIKNALSGGGLGIEKITTDMTDSEIDALITKLVEQGEKVFSNGTNFLLEKFIGGELTPRHIEVQMLENGELAFLPDKRDCSDQYLKAKMLEKSASGLSDVVDAKINAFCHKFVERIREAHGPIGIGTIEFLVDNKGGIYFMEINTRLQIEHGITSQRLVPGRSDVVIGALMDISRGVPVEAAIRDPQVEGVFVRQARIYGMDDNTQAPFYGTVQVASSKAKQIPGVTVNFVNGDDPYITNPKLNHQFGEVIAVDTSPEKASKKLLDALGEIEVVQGETNIPLTIDLLNSNPMQGNPDIHTMQRVIEDRQAVFKKLESIRQLQARAAATQARIKELQAGLPKSMQRRFYSTGSVGSIPATSLSSRFLTPATMTVVRRGLSFFRK